MYGIVKPPLSIERQHLHIRLVVGRNVGRCIHIYILIIYVCIQFFWLYFRNVLLNNSVKTFFLDNISREYI